MDDQTTTTSEEVVTEANESSQPTNTNQNEAADEQTEDTTSAPTTNEPATADNSDDLTEWAKKKGLDPSDPEAALKAAREAEQLMHRKTKEAAELRKAMDQVPVSESASGDDRLDTALRKIEISDFFNRNPEALDYESDMVEIVSERPDLAQANDFEAIYALARLKTDTRNTQAVRQEAKREARQEQQQAERSSAPEQAASATGETSQGFTDDEIAAMSPQDYLMHKRAGRIQGF